MKQKPKRAHYQKSANWLRRRVGALPKIAVILGSGLGAFAQQLQDPIRFRYSDIPHFPRATVHKGELLYGKLHGVPVWVFVGRFHCYEGYAMWQTAYPIGVLHLLGVEQVILTNAAGGISPTLQTGDFVCVTDHIKLTHESPCFGAHATAFGPRFFTLQQTYDKQLLALAKECAKTCQIPAKEGVYAYMGGPQYETEAEVRMLASLGADVVGMSTVAEVIFCAQCGIKVLCLSCVSNMAVGISSEPVAHEAVEQVGADRSADFCAWLSEIVKSLARQTPSLQKQE